MCVYKWKQKKSLTKKKEGSNTVLPLLAGGFPENKQDPLPVAFESERLDPKKAC